MFLDDELLEMIENAEINSAEDVQQLNVDVCTKCEQYYKSRISIQSTRKEVRTVLHKAFNLFDSFVRNAKKHKRKDIQLLGDAFEKHTFKQQLLSNEDFNRVYQEL